MSRPTPHRRPGGQLGNLNALKHGFYTRRIHKRDLSGTDNVSAINLAEEIALIRIFTRKLVESSHASNDPYELAGVLRILCLASLSITRIIKAQALLTDDDSGLKSAIDEAIRQVNAEMHGQLSAPYQTLAESLGLSTSKD